MKIISNNEIGRDFFAKIEFENISSVKEIIDDVKNNKDKALIKYSKKFGDGEITSFQITEEEIESSLRQIDEKALNAIKYAIKNVREFAKKQFDCLHNLDTYVEGSIMGHRIVPLETVGCYIPGGNYPLPSSAVMTIVPAKVAGVKNIIAVSPKIQPVTIAACALSGADKIFRIGGVQAIAGLAYGTESIPKADKIVGPGNKFVTSAKKQVFGECGIDFLAGPSEVLIIADNTANPKFVAADMLAQCEHDKDARSYLVCFSEKFAQEVNKYAEEFLQSLPTSQIARLSYDKSYAVVVSSLEEAIKISDQKAPEHLELCFENAQNLIDKFHNYGSLFIGNYSAEVFGDYVSGTNHTLPTNQVAKYSGGLSVFDYVKVQTYQILKKEKISEIASQASILAENEGLYAHKLASDLRKNSI